MISFSESRSARIFLLNGSLVLLTLSPWIGRSLPAGPVSLQPFEAIAGVLLFVWLLDLLRNWRRPWRVPMTQLSLLTGACILSVCLIITAGVLSTVNAESYVLIFRFLGRFVLGLATLLFLLRALRTEERIQLVINALLAGAIISTVISLAGFVLPPLGDLVVRGDRAQGLLNHPNQLAMMLTAVLPLALGRLAWNYRQLRRWIVLAVIVGGVALTGSKANLLLSAGLIPLVLWSADSLKKGLSARIGAILATGVVLVLATTVGFFLLNATSPRTLATLQRLLQNPTETSTVSIRLELWSDALKLSEKYSPFGVGAAHSGVYLPYDHAHNVFIEFLLTTGWLGLFGVLALITSAVALSWHAIRVAGRQRDLPLPHRTQTIGLALGPVAYILANQTSDSFGGTTIVILWILLGLLVARLRLLPSTVGEVHRHRKVSFTPELRAYGARRRYSRS